MKPLNRRSPLRLQGGDQQQRGLAATTSDGLKCKTSSASGTGWMLLGSRHRNKSQLVMKLLITDTPEEVL